MAFLRSKLWTIAVIKHLTLLFHTTFTELLSAECSRTSGGLSIRLCHNLCWKGCTYYLLGYAGSIVGLDHQIQVVKQLTLDKALYSLNLSSQIRKGYTAIGENDNWPHINRYSGPM